MAEKPGPSTSSDPERADTDESCTDDESFDVSMDSSSTDTNVTSVLIGSDLARKRKIGGNPPVGIKRGRLGQRVTLSLLHQLIDLKCTQVNLSVSNKKQFCLGCREELSAKKSSVQLHIKSRKHVRSKEQLSKKNSVK